MKRLVTLLTTSALLSTTPAIASQRTWVKVTDGDSVDITTIRHTDSARVEFWMASRDGTSASPEYSLAYVEGRCDGSPEYRVLSIAFYSADGKPIPGPIGLAPIRAFAQPDSPMDQVVHFACRGTK